MAELNAAEVEQQAEASFAGGFKGTPPTEVAKVVPEPKVEKVDAAPVPAPKPGKPQYVRVTQQEWDNQKAMLGKVSSLESQIAKLTGSVPKADAIIQQVIEKVQAQTPAGVSVEFSDEDFAELAADFPELAKSTRASLERIFKKAMVKGTGAPAEAEPPKPVAAMDQDAVKAVVTAALKEKADADAAATQEKEMAELIAAYPDWDKTVGRPAAGTTEPVKTEWRTWLETQPADYQQTVRDSQSPAVVKASIEKFMAEKAPSAAPRPDRAATRRAAIEDAVTPRFDGSAPPLAQPTSAEEAFTENYEKYRRK